MNNTFFVNISDIHVCSDNKDLLNNKMKELLKYIQFIEKSYSYTNICILISGDIAQTGTTEEYSCFIDMISNFPEQYKIITSPGNHDHNFQKYTGPMRDILLRTKVEEVDDQIIEQCTKGQEEYFDFENTICNVEQLHNNLLVKDFELSNSLSIHAINTAWCSKISEKSGEIHFPIHKLLKTNKNKTNIAMLHHPLAWFEANNQKDFRNKLREGYDIIITGHEHLYDSFKITTETSKSLLIESLPLEDKHAPENGFYTFVADKDDIIIDKIIWDKDSFKHEKQFRKSDILEESSASTNNLIIQKDFYNYLIDTGTGFSHPDKDSLHLDDIFIYPNIKFDTGKDSSLKRISARKLITSTSYSKVIISGEESIGKTTLLRKFYLELVKDKKIPVLIDGTKIKKAKNYSVEKLEKEIKKQYRDTTLFDISLKDNKKILLIDNFDQIKGNDEVVGSFLEVVTTHFDNIIITVSETYDIGIKSSVIFNNEYSRCSLLRFGFRLRYELINKWNSIKEPCLESKSVLTIHNDVAVKTVNQVIGKNYIPSTPLFLLTMIQSMDNGSPSDINTSSYGYYYQYLITSSLGASAVKKENLDEMFNYIKELSFHYYKKDIREETPENLWVFNRDFCTEYDLQIDARPRIDLLVKAKILNKEHSTKAYSFKYPYIYYFFIAKYLAEDLSSSSTQETIKKLVDSLEKRKSMNILMFLTHHTKDESILNLIIEKSSQLFEDYKETKLDIDTKFIDDIVQSLPEVRCYNDYQNTHGNRQLAEQIKDEHYDNSNIDDNDDDESRGTSDELRGNDKTSNLIEELNKTFKSLELLGQLARNYYGSLKSRPKQGLLEEAISAPLRALGSIFFILKEEPDDALNMIRSRIEEQINPSDNLSKGKLDEIARQALFSMMTTVTYSIIKKISSSIGNINLLPVIEKVANASSSNAKSLILLATKLDLGKHLVEKELKKLVRNASSNGLSTTLLKALVVDYLYMFEVKDMDVQKICSITGVKYQQISQQIALEKITKSK